MKIRRLSGFSALLALALGTSIRSPRSLAHIPTPPPPVPREFRAAWATPIWDRGFRDWPSAAGLTPDSQRTELRTMLDHAVAIGLNAVILHVRIAGDAMYPSKYAPWSPFLTGKSGEAPSPSYDPLAFAVEEAHARGLQLHAWFNPFRALTVPYTSGMAASHVTRAHPEWIRKYGTQTWIDPGDPAARKYVLETILDVVKRYDIDGIHIDDYFYPYRESRTVVRRVKKKRVRQTVQLDFPDDKTWKKYGKAKGWTDRDAWRRANIDDFIESLYKDTKAIKRSVLVGISPFGIWRPGSPPGVTGLDAYEEIYADSRRWLAEGWLDFIVPQLYWEVGGTQDRFRALDAWWRGHNPLARYVWPGLYTSHVYGGRDAWAMSEIRTQVATIRDTRIGSLDVPGHVHFRLAALFANDDRLASTMSEMYGERALVPAFPWLGGQVPAAPVISFVESNADGPAAAGAGGAVAFSVTPGDSSQVRWWLIQTRGVDGKWTTSLRPAGDGKLAASAFGTDDPDEIAVTAIGPTGLASEPAIAVPGQGAR